MSTTPEDPTPTETTSDGDTPAVGSGLAPVVDTNGLYRDPRDSPRARAAELMRRWGITPEEFDALVAQFNTKCRLCERVFQTEGGIALDMDPGTRRVRGLLCWDCNAGLAGFSRSADRLRDAADYLEGPCTDVTVLP